MSNGGHHLAGVEKISGKRSHVTASQALQVRSDSITLNTLLAAAWNDGSGESWWDLGSLDNRKTMGKSWENHGKMEVDQLI